MVFVIFVKIFIKMNNNLGYLLLLIIGLSMFSACKKYEDNPYIFSLRTKEARVVNSWKYELVLRNGLDVTTGVVTDSENEITIDYNKSSIGFDDEGRFATWIHFNEVDTLTGKNLVQYDGSWEFQSDKEQLLLTYDNPAPPTGDSEVWNLTRLQHRQLWWVENTDNGNNIEYRLMPANPSGGLFQ